MKNALEWIKSNPLIVTAGTVSFIGILVLVYFLVVSAPEFRKEKSQLLAQTKARQDVLMKVTVPIPNPDPNAPPMPEQVVINDIVTRDIKKAYDEIRTQYSDILSAAVDKNARNHRNVMLGGGELWPDKDPDENFQLYIRARGQYLDHFKALFDFRNQNRWNLPSMVASRPPSAEEIQVELQKSAFNFITGTGAESATALTQKQAESLYAEQRMVLMRLLKDRAEQINLYVDLRPEDVDPFAIEEADTDTPGEGGSAADTTFRPGTSGTGTDDEKTGYPFDIAPWSKGDTQPRPDQLWEGQVQLWIIRDVMGAIAKTNQVGKLVEVFKPDGSVVKEAPNVLNSPIKRLISLRMVPGYVGLHTKGALASDSSFGFASTAVFGGSGTGSPAQESVYPVPPVNEVKYTQPSQPAPEHFGITPTGRVSNSVFDVRHCKLVMDIEWKALPGFMEQLRQINFMTVIRVNTETLDEYELLSEGYVYGRNNVVRAELVIESLWFRDWTGGFTPQVVKDMMLFKPATADPNADPAAVGP